MSTKRELKRIPFGTDVAVVAKIMAEDGAMILTGALTREQVDAVNADLDIPFNKLSQGNKADNADADMADFLGYKTKRLPHTLRYSKTWREDYLASPILDGYINALVPGSGGSHAYTSSHAIEIHPGETAQPLHRDGEYFYKALGKNGPGGAEILILNLFALTDVTEDMGATRVIPGSHLWEDYSVRATHDQTTPALLNAGDVLLYTGRTLHGGGANTTKNKSRRVITNGYTLGFIMGEEAFPFAIPWEEARHYPKRVRAGMGFRSVSFAGEDPGFLWRVESRPLEDVLQDRHPMAEAAE